jgi:hypothetical protein
MMAEQRLKHVVFEIDSVLYFYDGELPVEGGVVTIPDGADVWAGAAWVQGYQIEAETGEHVDHNTVVERARGTAAVAESDDDDSDEESGEDDADEGADAGRQPAVEDGVRTSEQPRADELPLEGDGSGDGDGAADGEVEAGD